MVVEEYILRSYPCCGKPWREIEKKNQELMREHKYVKEKIGNLQREVSKQSAMEDKFNQDIEELSQETENLVSEIEKWQT